MKTNKRGCGFGCGVVIVALMLGSLAFAVVYYYQAKKAAAPFKGLTEKSQMVCSQCQKNQKVTFPYRQGKVLVVYSATGQTIGHTMAEKILKGIVATNPDEVQTLVCVGEQRKQQEGVYRDGAPAYRLYRDICLINWQTGEMINQRTLAGSAPPKVKNKKGADYGTDPEYYELTSFILSLTEK